jgi:D-alanyl-D-alanine carboxypeptidase
MSRTTFRNAHGLPNSKQVTTARDMARLGIALREHFPR